MEVRALDVAQHEAAHVVVGVALGLRLERADVALTREAPGVWLEGYAWFRGRSSGRRRREAWALMYAAGIAWDRGMGLPPVGASLDARYLRALVSGRHGAETCVTAAAAVLAGRMRAHARVTRALLEGACDARVISRIACGE